MKVLIGVDGSEGALHAVRRAVQFLSADRDRVAFYLSVAHAHPQSAAAQHAVLEQVREHLAQEVFDEAAAVLPAEFRPQVETFYDAAKPAAGLLAVAERWQAEWVVVGARGRGPLAQMLLGSVARSVVHAARLPVLVVRGASSAPPRVLLAYDGAEASLDAAEFLSRLSWPPQTQGRLVSVLEHYSLGPLPEWIELKPRDPEIEAMTRGWVDEYEQLHAAREKELVTLARRMPEPFRAAPPQLFNGVPADELLRVIVTEKIDLAVVGSSNSGTLARWIIGSVSDTVLTYAPCSVLVVPKRA